jgi:hypothetical protein
MTKPTAYFVATFSDGKTLARSSDRRAYAFAWKTVAADGQFSAGFAGTEALARAAAETNANQWAGVADFKRITTRPRGGATPQFFRWQAERLRDAGGKAAYLAKVTAARATIRTFVAPVVEVDRATWEAAR